MYNNNIHQSDSDEDPYTKKQLFEDDDCEGSGSNDEDHDILE